MNFTVTGFIVGIIFSAMGYYFFVEGKRRTLFSVMIAGLLLLIVPFFTSSNIQDLVIGGGLSAFSIWQLRQN
jgi:hypothetical protein